MQLHPTLVRQLAVRGGLHRIRIFEISELRSGGDPLRQRADGRTRTETFVLRAVAVSKAGKIFSVKEFLILSKSFFLL